MMMMMIIIINVYCKYLGTVLHGTGTLRCLQKEMATYRH